MPNIDAIKQHEGVNRLLESFPVLLMASQVGDIIGVVIDADTDLHARWQGLRNRLLQAGFAHVPESPDPAGTIIDPPADVDIFLPRVGIWIMPDNQTTGILEDFLQFLIPAESRLFDHVKTSVAGIPPDERRYPAVAEPKVQVHTWLAWQEEPGKPLGTAITARYLDADVAQVDVFVAWLNRLFFA